MQTALALPVPGPVPAPIAPPPTARSKVTPPKPAAAKKLAASTGPNPSILFGLDQRGRAHAACFVGGDIAAVERAADAMDLYCVVAETDALRDLGAKLPVGKLFGSGKALAPFCSGALYDQLLTAAGIADAPRAVKAAGKAAEAGGGAGGKPSGAPGGSGAGDPPATRVGAKAPADHAQIGLGSRVLAEDQDEGGYYPATVVATKADDAFVLRWAGFPDLPEFARPRRALALLHPEAVEAGA